MILILFGAHDCVMNVHYYKCYLVIIKICFACFIEKQHTVFNLKNAFSVICVSPDSAKTLFR